ncbi:MAG: hypothetical protein WC794_06375 [Candidatus Doudnabacteria bacterium]|jgi:hypothetical protein
MITKESISKLKELMATSDQKCICKEIQDNWLLQVQNSTGITTIPVHPPYCQACIAQQALDCVSAVCSEAIIELQTKA